MTTRHENCTAAYTLTAMVAGTYSVALVPVLQWVIKDSTVKAALPILSPNALWPILVRDVGSMILIRPLQNTKALLAIVITPVGMSILSRLAHP